MSYQSGAKVLEYPISQGLKLFMSFKSMTSRRSSAATMSDSSALSDPCIDDENRKGAGEVVLLNCGL